MSGPLASAGGPFDVVASEDGAVATTFTVSDIISDVATVTNSPAFSASTRVTSAQVTYWLTQAVRALSALLRQYHYDDRELLLSTSLVTVAGTKTVDLPANCGEVHAVLWARESDQYELLHSAQQEDLENRTTDGWEQWAPRYRLEGDKLSFYPLPQAVHTLELIYTTDLSIALAASGGTDLVTRLDGDRWVTLYLAEKVFTAKRDMAGSSDMMRQRLMLEELLMARGRERDASRTHTIRDVRGERLRAAYRRRGWSN